MITNELFIVESNTREHLPAPSRSRLTFVPRCVAWLLALAALSLTGAYAITIDFDTASGYTSGLLEAQPSSGPQWARVSGSESSGAAYVVTGSSGVDRANAAAAQSSGTAVTSSIYYFNPTNADLVGTFTGSSIVDYSFSLCLSNTTSPSTYVGRVWFGPESMHSTPNAGFTFYSDGHILAANGDGNNGNHNSPSLTTSATGSAIFYALPGIYFTISGQLDYATKSYTVFLNGVAQTTGTAGDYNFGFSNNGATSEQIALCVTNSGLSTWRPFSVDHIECYLDPTWSAPMTISTGGTYSGAWAASGSATHAITVTTSAPVTITDSYIKGQADLIYTYNAKANLTVTNCKVFGVNPNVKNQDMPRFINAWYATSLTVTNNYMENTMGIYMIEGSTPGTQSVNVSNNDVFNVDGRQSDGALGWSGSYDQVFAHFFQVGDTYTLKSGTVAWNKIINTPDNSATGDIISFYRAGATGTNNPNVIYDNLIEGGYPYPINSTTLSHYSACGIVLGDGSCSSGTLCCCYNHAYYNVITDTGHGGIGIVEGNNNTFTDNQIFSSGTIGLNLDIQGYESGGCLILNDYHESSSVYFNNSCSGNEVGWFDTGWSVPSSDPNTYDYYFQSGSDPNGPTANTWFTGTVSEEQTAINGWYGAVTSGTIPIGPDW